VLRIRIAVTVAAADVGQAATVGWGVFQVAAGDENAGWDTAVASAEIRPAGNSRK
jgi:hypothetical protein